jgi:hypothetical protein
VKSSTALQDISFLRYSPPDPIPGFEAICRAFEASERVEVPLIKSTTRLGEIAPLGFGPAFRTVSRAPETQSRGAIRHATRDTET